VAFPVPAAPAVLPFLVAALPDPVPPAAVLLALVSPRVLAAPEVPVFPRGLAAPVDLLAAVGLRSAPAARAG
jgi:hypothetical protein